jgi:hypothetical protein
VLPENLYENEGGTCVVLDTSLTYFGQKSVLYLMCTVLNSILYPSPDNIRVLRSRGVKWIGMGRMRNAYRIEEENLKRSQNSWKDDI